MREGAEASTPASDELDDGNDPDASEEAETKIESAGDDVEGGHGGTPCANM